MNPQTAAKIVGERHGATTDPRRAEEALRQGEQQLRLITDATPGLISYIDTDLRYRFVNRQYEVWFDRPRQEVIGKTVVEVLGEAAVARLRPYMESALRGEETRFEAEVPYRDGGTRWVEHLDRGPGRDDHVPQPALARLHRHLPGGERPRLAGPRPAPGRL